MSPHKPLWLRHLWMGLFVVRRLRYFHTFHQHDEMDRCL